MKRLIGGILLAIGLLIAGASGLCSAVFLWSMIQQNPGDGSIVPLIAVFGGIPFVVGLGLFFWGRALIRSDNGEGPRSF